MVEGMSGSRISLMQTTIFTGRSLDRDVHRNDPVKMLAQEVPFGLWLGAAELVGGTRHDPVAARRVDAPQIRPALPEPPVGRVFDVCIPPRLATVDAHLDANDCTLAAPGEAADRVLARRERRILRTRFG